MKTFRLEVFRCPHGKHEMILHLVADNKPAKLFALMATTPPCCAETGQGIELVTGISWELDDTDVEEIILDLRNALDGDPDEIGFS